MSARAAIKQDDLTRICRGLEAAGRRVTRVVVRGAEVTILTDADPAKDGEGPNPWDEELGEEG